MELTVKNKLQEREDKLNHLQRWQKVKLVIANKIAYQKKTDSYVHQNLYEMFFNAQCVLDLLVLSGDYENYGFGTFCYKNNLNESDVKNLIHQNCNASYKLVKSIYKY